VDRPGPFGSATPVTIPWLFAESRRPRPYMISQASDR
jgi:hypothetical protein